MCIRTTKTSEGDGFMKDKELVFELMKNNNGVLESRQAAEAGIDNKILQRLNKSGEIERIEHGIYIDANYIKDEYLVTQYRCKKGIFSHETALFLHDLTDRTPFQLTLTIPTGYNTRLLKEKDKYKFFYIHKDLHEIGEMTLLSPHGNKIVVYNKERTLCDCIKKKDQLDTDLVIAAVKQYMKEPGADFAKLLEYAEIFNVRKLMRQYMEVLS